MKSVRDKAKEQPNQETSDKKTKDE